ncbi:hypothetical protein AB0L65_53110 [Nonomuraea sp. NPDC052116]|uniref:hypothetical protein n=1 Tax=Nonomuraea sp. NPDC052116 TaxID=3155665 RepID=UPI00344029A9
MMNQTTTLRVGRSALAAALAGAVALTGAAPDANAAAGKATLGPFGYGNFQEPSVRGQPGGPVHLEEAGRGDDLRARQGQDASRHRLGLHPTQLRATYPNLKQNALYGTYAAVPGNPKAIYVFAASKRMVLGVTLVMTAQTCLR